MQNASSNVLCLPSYRYLLMIVPRVLQFSFIFIWQVLSCDRHNPFQANVPFICHSWQRGPNSLILWRPTHYIAYPLFSIIFQLLSTLLILRTPPFLWEKSERPLFWEISKTQPPFIKGRGSNYDYTPWKRQKIKSFLTFSGGIEMEHLR